ncbi:hypothetical protein JXI42_08860 [bacterium]|nr:hypothetical protein [bacterium]
MFNYLFNFENPLFLFVELLVGAIVIIYFGSKLAKYGDKIAEITGMSGTWVGLIVLSIITSMPEFTTSIASVTLVHAPNLACGNIFGSNVFNLFIIAILDLIEGPGPILRRVKISQTFPAALGILLVTFAIIGLGSNCILTGMGKELTNFIGWMISFSILIGWLIGMNLVNKFETGKSSHFSVPEHPEFKNRFLVYGKFAVAAIAVVLTGIYVVYVANQLASSEFHLFKRTIVLGQTFVGTIFVAIITSFPELVVSITAYRIGATNMAIANLLGSNTFNLLIIPVLEVITGTQTIFSLVEFVHIIPAILVVLLTCVTMMGLSYRSEKSFLYLGWDAIMMIILFFIGNYVFFKASIFIR